MARLEVLDVECTGIGQEEASADIFFRLGMMYSTGRSVEPDMIAAHKWFNLAALKGSDEAARYRQEVAAELSRQEVAEAQRAAREWLRAH